MERTRNRPIPAGRLSPTTGVVFSLAIGFCGLILMASLVNPLAAAIALFGHFFYVFVYTMWLKRRTPQNIVIGGAAGAFPPMIGWAAVTGDISSASIVLFCIIFFWTPPHFCALSLFANADYKAANIPMMPVVAGERSTKIQMLFYSLLLVPLSVAPYTLHIAGLGYGIFAFALSVFFLFTNFRVLVDKTDKSARLMFGYSVFYLFALFAALMIDKV